MDEAKLLDAIARIVDEKLEKQFQDVDRRFDEFDRRFDEFDRRFDEFDRKLEKQSQEMNEKLDKQTSELKAYIKSNNIAIGEVFTQALEETVDRVNKIQKVTMQNSYDIALLKQG